MHVQANDQFVHFSSSIMAAQIMMMLADCTVNQHFGLRITKKRSIIAPLNLQEAERKRMKLYIEIGLIITSVALIISVILQSKGAGLGGLTGADTGGVYSVRRGIERTLFYITIGLSVLFFILAIASIFVKS
jgi:preprotein translocase subunit SecG